MFIHKRQEAQVDSERIELLEFVPVANVKHYIAL